MADFKRRNFSGQGKEITIASGDFLEVSTDVAARLCAKLNLPPAETLLLAVFCKELGDEMFGNAVEGLEIAKEE